MKFSQVLLEYQKHKRAKGLGTKVTEAEVKSLAKKIRLAKMREEEEAKFGDLFDDAKDDIEDIIDSLQDEIGGDLPEDDVFEDDVRPSERKDAPDFDFDDDEDDDDFDLEDDDDDDDDDDEDEKEEELEESFKKFVKAFREHKFHRTGSKKFTETEFKKLKIAFKEQLKE
jgi:hypothetical protein